MEDNPSKSSQQKLSGGNMNSSYEVKQITRLYNSCNECGLPVINCMCQASSKTQTHAKIWILSTEKEFYRPSNTARLLKLVNPESTEIFLWERTKEPERLIGNLSSEVYEVYLVFPAENEDTQNRKAEYKVTNKTPAFIIIDGTWKEARKILRKSDYLKKLPVISLEPQFKSQYDLRKGAAEGNLCTIEAAIEVLRLAEETKSTHIIQEAYGLFLKRYKAGRSGHELKERIEGD